jgi:hypothetical protein
MTSPSSLVSREQIADRLARARKRQQIALIPPPRARARRRVQPGARFMKFLKTGEV